MSELTLDVLTEAVKGSAAAFRCRRRLSPAGGDGDKVFPPTRLANVILGDTEIGDKPFRKSDKGRARRTGPPSHPWGRGYEKIRDACRKAATPEPTVEYDGGGVWLRWSWQVPDEPRETPTQSQPGSELEPELESQLESRVLVALVDALLGKAAIARLLGQRQPSGPLHVPIQRLVEAGSHALTLPDKPNSRLHKYRLTPGGKAQVAGRGDDVSSDPRIQRVHIELQHVQTWLFAVPLRRMAEGSEISAFKIRGQWRIRRTTLARWRRGRDGE